MGSKFQEKAKEIRKITFEMLIKAGKGHLGGSFSCVEILVALYYSGILKPDDDFILSKGHANGAYYTILADLNILPKEQLDLYCHDDGILGGHCELGIPGVSCTTGSLGHGLSIAAGMAFANKLDNKDNQVYVLIGDGEMQEGSIWESLIFINQHNLNNLTLIVDHNTLASEDHTDNTGCLNIIEDKLRSFGFNVNSINGHDINEINRSLIKSSYKPKAIVANTIKGKGISFFENQIFSHCTLPKGNDIEKARNELL